MDDAKRVAQAFELALASLEDSKAEAIIPIDMRGKSALGDYMIIASGRSHRHVSAVADHLLRALRETGYRDIKVEGLEVAKGDDAASKVGTNTFPAFEYKGNTLRDQWKIVPETAGTTGAQCG